MVKMMGRGALSSSDQLLKTEVIQTMAGAASLSAFTYIPILARDYLGADEFFVTILVGGYATAAFFASYIFGRAGDIYGRRIVVRIGLLASMISFGLLLFASTSEILLIVRVMGGFCIGIYPGALAAYAFESEMKMGKFASFGAAGWGVGTLLAGYAALFDIYYAFLMSTLFLAVGFGTALSLPDIKRTRIKVPLFPIDTLKRNWPVYSAVLIRHSSASAIWTLWPLFLTDLGGDLFMVSVVQAVNSIAQVVFMIALTDRYNCRFLVAVGMITSAITFVWFTLAQNIWEIIPSQILLGFAWAFLYVGALKYVTERNEEKSTASGLLSSTMSLSMVIGPIIAAILYSIWPSYTPIMIFAAIMSALGFIIFHASTRGEEFPTSIGEVSDTPPAIEPSFK
jgi:MFS family permease